MAFDGRLLVVGDYRFPLEYIRLDSYKTTPNQRLDRDSYEDANGDLQRTALNKTRTKIEFETPYMHYREKQDLMSHLLAQYSISQANLNERKVWVTYYDDEKDIYNSAYFYIPDITWSYYNIDEVNIDIIYKPTRFAFIEY